MSPSANSIRLLVIDDDEADRMLLRRALKASGVEAEIVEAVDGATGMAAFRRQTFDCVLLDYRLPDLSGVEILRQLIEENDSHPAVVMLTGHMCEKLEHEVLEAGAVDYLIKDDLTPSLLRVSLQHSLACLRLRGPARRQSGQGPGLPSNSRQGVPGHRQTQVSAP